ncbi:18717_t:CDS:2 [Rhizophagus irregularis]|nr:18717_t:CDS:2 [Rhizophagus irregularis]
MLSKKVDKKPLVESKKFGTKRRNNLDHIPENSTTTTEHISAFPLSYNKSHKKIKLAEEYDLSNSNDELDLFFNKSIHGKNAKNAKNNKKKDPSPERFKRSSSKRSLGKKNRESQIRPIDTRNQKSSPNRSFGQASSHRSEIFQMPSFKSTSKSEPKTQPMEISQSISQFTESPINTWEICAAELRTKDVQSSRINNFYDPGKKRDEKTSWNKKKGLHDPSSRQISNVYDPISISDDEKNNGSSNTSHDETEAFIDRFRAPSPIRNKYENLPEMDFLSIEEEILPIQNNSWRKSEEYKLCPFCKEPIPFPLPDRIRTYLIKINSLTQDKWSNKEQTPSLSILLQRPRNVVEEFEFCRLHESEALIVPEGLKKNYPININFDILPKRVKKLIPELMLVIKGEINSSYRNIALNAYRKYGRARARKPTILMGRFQKLQPGYYGSKGAYKILSTLVSLLMNTNILTMDMTKPQEPVEYLQQVLVPETAIRLISQDRGGISLDEAKKVMEDSIEFGMYVHDIDEEID